MTMDLFVARSMITKASLVDRGQIEISGSQVSLLFSTSCFFLLYWATRFVFLKFIPKVL